MIYAQVNATEREALDAEMKRTTEAKWYRRLKVIDLSSHCFMVSVPSRATSIQWWQ